MALATVQDYFDYIDEEFEPSAVRRIERLLVAVDGLVKNYTSQILEFVEDDTISFIRPRGDLFLPETPVVAVDAIEGDGTTFDADGYSWGSSGLISFARMGSYGSPELIEVTYTHGYAVIPEEIKLVCVQVVERIRANPLALRWQASGPFSMSAADPTDALTASQQAVLDKYRPLVLQ